MNAPPKPNDSKPVWELVIEDMHARDQFGRAKYHTPLQMGNGRNHAQDAYEEVLDLAVYMKQMIIERAELRAELERQPKWRCFHCGESFTEAQSKLAREHFGRDEGKTPVCLMRVPGESGLIAALRRAEDDIAEWRNENVPLMRAVECQAADHAQALIREEEKGYAKGLKDYSKLEAETIALRAEVERLRAENAGLRNALSGVPDPIAFMAAVDALLSLPNVDNRISMWTAEIEAFRLLRATRGKRP